MKLSLAFCALSLALGFSSVVTAITVDEVCVKSAFPQACAQILNSDPRHTSDDLVVFAHIAIDKATASVTDTDKKVKSLLSEANDSISKRNLNVCVMSFDFAVSTCGRANDLLRTGDFGGLNGVGSVVNGSGVDCHASLGGSELMDETTEARVVGEVLGLIANLLASSDIIILH